MLENFQPEYWSQTGPTGLFYYGHGILFKAGLLGHGGQALGFQSDGGYLPDRDVTIVIWGNSAENALANAGFEVAGRLGLIGKGQ